MVNLNRQQRRAQSKSQPHPAAEASPILFNSSEVLASGLVIAPIDKQVKFMLDRIGLLVVYEFEIGGEQTPGIIDVKNKIVYMKVQVGVQVLLSSKIEIKQRDTVVAEFICNAQLTPIRHEGSDPHLVQFAYSFYLDVVGKELRKEQSDNLQFNILEEANEIVRQIANSSTEDTEMTPDPIISKPTCDDRPLTALTVQFFDLFPEESLTLVCPLLAILEEWESSEFVARIPELGIYGNGSSEEEAIRDLKTSIVDLHKFAVDNPPATLAPPLLFQCKRVMKLVQACGAHF